MRGCDDSAEASGVDQEARDVWELQPPGMGIGQRAASNGETGCKAWRGEIYIHGRAGIRPSMADGEMWAPTLQEMRMGARSAELGDGDGVGSAGS